MKYAKLFVLESMKKEKIGQDFFSFFFLGGEGIGRLILLSFGG